MVPSVIADTINFPLIGKVLSDPDFSNVWGRSVVDNIWLVVLANRVHVPYDPRKVD